ncbi:hypothetical protein [Duganella sp. HH105]|uniref:hypothetical protein n=1 Tax=Duganella sp. HH105 TaxID=1781067 RepID=UPI00114CEF39|nr:hypothetical protein [Duganella sp. HH105]
MKININLCIFAASFSALTGCALGPRIVSDFSGLGTSEVAMVLASDFLKSREKIEKDITILVNRRDILDAVDRSQELSKLGFSCPFSDKPLCSYNGSLNYKLQAPPGKIGSHSNATEIYSIALDYSKEPISIKIKVEVNTI